MTMRRGPLIILSGPSGCGKSTVIVRLRARGDLPMRLSVSATTRPPRDTEQDGVHYHFWTREQFERELHAGAFLEWATVYGHHYGTLKREVEPYRQQGQAVILDIDTQGADQVRKQCADAVSIFLLPPSLAALEARLRRRGTESEAALERRLAGAQREMSRAGEFDYRVTNEDLNEAVAQIHAIVANQFEGGMHAG
jgi:guanylate kinase